jgi:hypothetical protein
MGNRYRSVLLTLIALACTGTPADVDVRATGHPVQIEEPNDGSGSAWVGGIFPSGLPAVRVIYAVPNDKIHDPDHDVAMLMAMLDLQRWYKDEMAGGGTFALVWPSQRCRLPEPESHYLSPVERSWGRFYRLRDAVRETCADIVAEREFATLIFADIDEPCQGAQIGAAVKPQTYTAGYALLRPPYFVCDGASSPWSRNRWVGGTGHELGHALGLPHPPGCDEGLPTCDRGALMKSHWLWPDTYLRDDEREILAASDFVR